MIDEILVDGIPENVKLFPIAMVHDKQIFLIRAREEDIKTKEAMSAVFLLWSVMN